MSSRPGISRAAGRVRPLALVLALLCGLGIVAPAAAQAAGTHRVGPHPIAISARMLDDSGTAVQRLDQPVGVSLAARVQSAAPMSLAGPDTAIASGSTAVWVERTRGPPRGTR